jgi:hypothetical protein
MSTARQNSCGLPRFDIKIYDQMVYNAIRKLQTFVIYEKQMIATQAAYAELWHRNW